tara:strand:+ start:10713 stop:11435 length:723 start_codon:yes stop_codon:yes gene_type:complete
MRKIFSLMLITIIISCADKTKVVFLGDSITDAGLYDKEIGLNINDSIVYPKYTGFITLIKDEIGSEIELIGKGVSGDKVSDLLARYNEDVIALQPNIVFIYIGINDVWHKYDFGTGSDIDFYEKGLRTIITDIKRTGAKIVLCTPTVIGENTGDFLLGNNFKDVETMEKMDADLDNFSNVIRGLSDEFETDLLDLRQIFTEYIRQNNPENKPDNILTYDGVHLNDMGNKLIADGMIEFLK